MLARDDAWNEALACLAQASNADVAIVLEASRPPRRHGAYGLLPAAVSLAMDEPALLEDLAALQGDERGEVLLSRPERLTVPADQFPPPWSRHVSPLLEGFDRLADFGIDLFLGVHFQACQKGSVDRGMN